MSVRVYDKAQYAAYRRANREAINFAKKMLITLAQARVMLAEMDARKARKVMKESNGLQVHQNRP